MTPSLTAAFSVDRILGSYGDYSLGFEVKELGKTNAVKFGAKIRLNI